MEKRWYGIYAGSCNSPELKMVLYSMEDEAESIAYECAEEDYESYAGLHGLPSIDDVKEEYPDADEETVYEIYYEYRDGWLNYEIVDFANLNENDYRYDEIKNLIELTQNAAQG